MSEYEGKYGDKRNWNTDNPSIEKKRERNVFGMIYRGDSNPVNEFKFKGREKEEVSIKNPEYAGKRILRRYEIDLDRGEMALCFELVGDTTRIQEAQDE